MSAPQAEMSTAGVIIAVNTASAEESASIRSYGSRRPGARIMKARGARGQPDEGRRMVPVARDRKFFRASRESIGSRGRKLCYAPPKTRQRFFRCTQEARTTLALARGHTSHKGEIRCQGREMIETT